MDLYAFNTQLTQRIILLRENPQNITNGGGVKYFMDVYVITNSRIELEKRNARKRMIIVVIILLAFCIGVAFILSPSPLLVIIITVPMLSIVLANAFRRGYKMVQENWSSYQLLVGPDIIVRKQIRLSDLEIHREQIKSIEERIGTGLAIKTTANNAVINIPEGLEDYQQLKERLSAWGPIKSKPVSKLTPTLMRVLPTLSFAAALLILLLSKTLAFAVTAGTFMILYCVWATFSLKLHSEQMKSAGMKARTWVMTCIMISFIVIAKIYSLFVK